MTKTDRWVEETFHPHWRVRLKADKVLHEVKTEHQDLVIFTNETWGTVLMLDGVCQLTTSDEFVYHEMMAHVPLMALSKPKRVLVVGGGDGGVLREVLKHPSIEKATLCEIDRSVVDLSLQHYPEIAGGSLDDPRTDLVIADGLKYVAETKERFDAIIVDSSEPIGPSAVLHTPEFFADCKRALKEGGILVTQNGLPFLFPEHLGATTRAFAGLFKHVAPYMCTQPCYFGGPFALNWASDDGEHLELSAKKLAKRQEKRGIVTRYWTPGVHVGAFALPAYAETVVKAAISGKALAVAPVVAKAKPKPKAKPVASKARKTA
ncbi:MAG: polyamine aminopropyltransferase [Hyphomicrobiaceae bacterium]